MKFEQKDAQSDPLVQQQEVKPSQLLQRVQYLISGALDQVGGWLEARVYCINRPDQWCYRFGPKDYRRWTHCRCVGPGESSWQRERRCDISKVLYIR